MLVNTALSMLDGKRLSKLFRAEYKNIPSAFPRILNKKYKHKSYALGFNVSREMLEDDIYGDIFNMKGRKKKLKVQTLHRVYINDIGSGVELDGDIFKILGSTTFDSAQAKDLVKAINMLIKLQKPKKVIKRRKRVKA